jgi:hypothetical protein
MVHLRKLNSTMETRDYSKNMESPKSQMSKENTLMLTRKKYGL